MNELKKILDDHAKWLRGDGGRRADLRGANLRGANLSEADLSYAYLRYADLSYANLCGANLRGANLTGADLRGADLSGDLRDADLRDANLTGADLTDTKGLHQQRIAAEGDLIGWKALKNGVIAKLRIPESARRMSAYGSRKCRAEYVYVIELFGAEESTDKRSGTITYRAGETVYPDSYDPDPREACSHGIHFFLTREEAEGWL